MADTLTDPLLGRLIDGRYEVRERIAAGGMATVYLAFDKRLERLVAVKVMHATFGKDSDQGEFASRFRREAKASARLTHPGLVRVYDQGTDGDLSYLTMEYVEGENLRARLNHESTLTVGESLAMIDAILDALSAAHRLGLVHRDVKPENVLIDEDGRPKLADFGLARAVTEVTQTSTGTVMGTVAYLAPELVQRGEADARTDIYAVGIMLFESLTGRQPFTAPSAIEVATRHVHEDVPPPSTYAPWLPAEIDLLVLALASREASGRPANATAALAMVRQTRAMIDEPTLDRKADPPSGAHRVVDDVDPDATTVFDPMPTGSTIALPIGLNEPLFAAVEAEIFDDPDAVEPMHSRPRWTVWVVAVVTAVLLTLGLGAWWYNTQGPGAYTVVPRVAEQTADEATAILSAAGLEAFVLTEYSDDVPADIVIRTEPDAQQQIAKGDTVKLVVSQGPRMEIVPAVVGTAEGDAIDTLSKAEFSVGKTDRVYSDTVPNGQVMSTNPVADESVRHDLPIDMVVSQGPRPVTIPELTGVTEEKARATLNGADFAMIVTVEYDRTTDVKKGEVFKTDPAAGSESTRTAKITIYVSEGKPQVEVPNFVQLTIQEAQKLADKLGLVLDFTPKWGVLSGSAKPDKIITDQREAVQTQVEVGSTIHLQYDSK